MRIALHSAALTSALLALASCGGGGGGERPALGAPPGATPTPTPAPPAIPLPTGALGLQSDRPFTTVAAWTSGWGDLHDEEGTVEIAYSAVDGRYTVKLPEYEEGRLIPRGGAGSYDSSGWVNLQSTYSDLTVGTESTTQNVRVTLDWPKSSPYTYTSFGAWSGALPMGENVGVFAYGIPTAGSDMPVTGSAVYNGFIRGITSGVSGSGGGPVGQVLGVWGTVSLSFDFGAGTLSGDMKPLIAPVWDEVRLGTYTFRDTVYSPGSTTFSGAFNAPGSSAPSFFLGSFNGPQGAEVMARWHAPFVYPGTTDESTMSGVWVAKRP